MLYTYIHHKEYSNTSWDVAHLYEHLVTYSFRLYLKSLGMHPELIGHVSGDTFEHILFLNATFYNKEVAEAYEHFLATPALVDTSFTPQVILEIETEERITLTLHDKNKFDSQLKSLTLERWIDNASLTSTSISETVAAKEVFQVKRTAKEFRDVVVGIYANVNELDSDEQVLFLRLSAISGDMVDFAVRINLNGTYYIGSTPISKNSDFIGNTHHIRFKRDINLKSIKMIAEDAIYTADIQSIMPLIAAQFEEFANSAAWKSVAIDYYRHTGILANNEYIAYLATPERISSIMSKLKIHVRVMEKSEEEQYS